MAYRDGDLLAAEADIDFYLAIPDPGVTPKLLSPLLFTHHSTFSSNLNGLVSSHRTRPLVFILAYTLSSFTEPYFALSICLGVAVSTFSLLDTHCASDSGRGRRPGWWTSPLNGRLLRSGLKHQPLPEAA